MEKRRILATTVATFAFAAFYAQEPLRQDIRTAEPPSQNTPTRLPEILRDNRPLTMPPSDRILMPGLGHLSSLTFQIQAPDTTNQKRLTTLDRNEVMLGAPASARPMMDRNPYAFDYSTQGQMPLWRGGFLYGSGSHTTLPSLMDMQNAELGIVQHAGNFVFRAGLTADRYRFVRGTNTVFGISGAATYNFNENLSMTVFGRFYNSRPFHSMAAFPYIGSSAYGGYVTYNGENAGIDVGMERVYDPFARRWILMPIITPNVKVWNTRIALPVGLLVRELFSDAVYGKRSNPGGIIMPEGALPMPQPQVIPPPSGQGGNW